MGATSSPTRTADERRPRSPPRMGAPGDSRAVTQSVQPRDVGKSCRQQSKSLAASGRSASVPHSSSGSCMSETVKRRRVQPETCTAVCSRVHLVIFVQPCTAGGPKGRSWTPGRRISEASAEQNDSPGLLHASPLLQEVVPRRNVTSESSRDPHKPFLRPKKGSNLGRGGRDYNPFFWTESRSGPELPCQNQLLGLIFYKIA